MFVLAPSIAVAQVQTTTNPSPSEAISAAASPDNSGLGEIIVTAQCRQESSQRAAIPLNVLQGVHGGTQGTSSAGHLNFSHQEALASKGY